MDINFFHLHDTASSKEFIKNRKFFEGAGTRKVEELLYIFSYSGFKVNEYNFLNESDTKLFFNLKRNFIDKYNISRNIFIFKSQFKFIRLFIQNLNICMEIIRLKKRKSIIIIYNTEIHFLIPFLLIKLLRLEHLIDIEDIPLGINKLRSFKDFLTLINFNIITRFSSQRFLLASNHFVKYLPKKAFYIPIQGVLKDSLISQEVKSNLYEKYFKQLMAKEKITFHYGGTIIRETGSDIVLATIKKIDNIITKKIDFIITGFGDMSKFRKLSYETKNVNVVIFENISQKAYVEIFKNIDCSICLKGNDTLFGSRTFPYKVIEIVSNFKLLIMAKNDQVKDFLGNSKNYFMINNNPYELTNTMLSIINEDKKILTTKLINNYFEVNNKINKDVLKEKLKKIINE